ncbi:ATP-binding cassette domain-containing protein (plasmid) [Aliiroseovarius crassostreae]|uniref:ATP-binding cassette domain-containing protein n=1 Tax=Aliiroseovarius crassostreae TaxID=154981 RepID=UPI0021AF581E|nr:ATP-binding cassette domain-containing protein [Aliiroseovarius crassostreae]UWQ12849.1 ATP-binding cassette domain-containing protein [Aliiroseovarius crassostreae]
MSSQSLFPIKARAVTVRRRGRNLIGPLDLTVEGQGVTIVLGPNGAGKTTLLRALHGIERLSGGQITYGCPRPEALAAQAFVFQTPVIMRRSVRENMSYPLALRKMPKADIVARVEEVADRVGLSFALNRPARVLSGGERQKLALGRALTLRPELLFLDEPCASLDGRATREIEDVLQHEISRGRRIIMSTHNLGQARRLAKDVWFVHKGQIHEAAPAEQFFNTPATEAARAFINGDIVE